MAQKEVKVSNEFPELSECKKNIIFCVLSNVSVVSGLYFEQLWYVDHQNVLYNGCAIYLKQSKKSQVPKVIELFHTGRMMNAKKKGRALQFHYTDVLFGRLYLWET